MAQSSMSMNQNPNRSGSTADVLPTHPAEHIRESSREADKADKMLFSYLVEWLKSGGGGG